MSFFTKEECETFAAELKAHEKMSPTAEAILGKLHQLDGDILAQIKANHELSSEVGGAPAIVSKALVTAVQHVADNAAPEQVRAQVIQIVTLEFITAQMEQLGNGPLNMWLSTEESGKESAIKGLYWHNEA